MVRINISSPCAAMFILLGNSSEGYIHQITFELRLNDDIFLMAPHEMIEKFEKIFT